MSYNKFDDYIKNKEQAILNNYERLKKLEFKIYRFEFLPKEYHPSNQRLESLFLNRLYIGNISDLNDPFDCKMYCFSEKDFDERFRNHHGDKPIMYKRTLAFAKSLLRNKLLFRQKSLTETYTSPAMWGYYSNNYHGFCVEYDCSKYREVQETFFPVIYENQREDIVDSFVQLHPLSNSCKERVSKVLYHTALRKHTDWAHEREWRFLFSGFDFTRYPFVSPPFPITSIILGHKIHRRYQEEIVNFAKGRNITVKKVRISTDTDDYLVFDNLLLNTSD